MTDHGYQTCTWEELKAETLARAERGAYPLFAFVGDELSEVAGRAREHRSAQLRDFAPNLGSARPALISLFSLATISVGVLRGAPRPVWLDMAIAAPAHIPLAPG